MNEERWLRETMQQMSLEGSVSSQLPPEYFDMFGSSVHEPCGPIIVYLLRLHARRNACKLGNFEFWSWERIWSPDQTEKYGSEQPVLIVADWMLDSVYCAVNVASCEMVFLGGVAPIVSTMSLADFLARVCLDPTFPHGFSDGAAT